MRLAPSFLLSLLLFAAILWSVEAAAWPAAGDDEEAAHFAAVHQILAADAAQLDALEAGGGELEQPELTARQVARLNEPPVTNDDRTELFGVPARRTVGVLAVREPPQAPVAALADPWLRAALRPPSGALRLRA
ncbi:hypothetical protein [Variovorax terrae]|uniref:Uncharacterized protein n=1 Tax=Variovorax terrae TaxID=2923278 RepID=A0A9X1VQP6_9BURK|nr:hypothetical protein [Variovorax terrae]MCJ0761634.1 hypothetical protein [Variovorax terrae]